MQQANERWWALNKFSDLSSTGRVYTNNVTLHIDTFKRTLTIRHNMQHIEEVLLWQPNLIIKTKENSVLIQIPHPIEKKIRFRLSGPNDFKDVVAHLAQFTRITDMNQISQDIFSQGSSLSQFSQNTFSQSSSSQNSFVESSYGGFRGQPDYYNNAYNSNVINNSPISELPMSLPVDQSSIKIMLQNRPEYRRNVSASQPSAREQRCDFYNPYTSPLVPSPKFDAEDSQYTCLSGNLQGTATISKKDMAVQTDPSPFKDYSVDELVKIIDRVSRDTSFKLLVSHINEAINIVKASKTTSDCDVIIEDIITEPNLRKRKASSQANANAEVAVALGRVEDLLKDFK